jgi:hypothetical protein
VGEQVAVTGHDLLAALALVSPDEQVWFGSDDPAPARLGVEQAARLLADLRPPPVAAQLRRWRTKAMPWPPPTHMVSRPNSLSRLCRPLSSVVVIRAPGGAERVAQRDRAAVDVEPVEVDAQVLVRRDDLGREGLVDLDQVHVVDRHAGQREGPPGRLDRSEPHDLGREPETPVDTIRASGVSPSSAALVSLMITTAAAPSLSGQQLPAVTVPSRGRPACSPETPSRVTPARGRRPRTPPCRRVVTGVISRSKKPSAIAFSARFCDRTPNSSCSAR